MDPSRTILLVEDRDDDIELTQRAFRKTNILNPLITVHDGEEALDYLFCRKAYASRPPLNPTVILLDLNLPKISGHEVLRQIRADARTALIPVVILTSSQEEQDVVSTYRDGANSYVRKPVKLEEFNEAVRQLGMYWLLLNMPAPVAPPPEDQ